MHLNPSGSMNLVAGWNTFFDFVFPQICELCEITLVPARAIPLCTYCHAALPRQPTPDEQLTGGSNSADAVIAPLLYAEYTTRLVAQLKFAHNPRAARILAAEIANVVVSTAPPDARPELLLPVPLSWRSQFRRGYNQAEWLAHYVGAALELPVDYHILGRRHSTSQRTLSRAQRLTLPDNTFHVRRDITPQYVAIIDDVYTTGATTRALANQLRRAGVERIDIWCAAKAVLA